MFPQALSLMSLPGLFSTLYFLYAAHPGHQQRLFAGRTGDRHHSRPWPGLKSTMAGNGGADTRDREIATTKTIALNPVVLVKIARLTVEVP
jgi:hypothetical protein